ncbi:hypothetical protein DPMN_184008 [Dreissena polymorpha]|uniref:Uncharacterized protein n=1 Tax=Dreissena polymorpha TaxID=45954 RepID=A0A9D4DJI1_DREPO|nr:hypothetical protein DPMN_184008 [Dreissena polymorpha]
MPKVAHLRYTGTDLIFAAKDVIGTNILTNFHEEKNAPPHDIIRTNLLTKFNEDWTINKASTVLTRKNAYPFLMLSYVIPDIKVCDKARLLGAVTKSTSCSASESTSSALDTLVIETYCSAPNDTTK